MEKIKNFTPHTIRCGDQEFPSEGTARVSVETQKIEGNFPVPLSISKLSETITGLPAPETGIFFIVSRLVAEALPSRKDLLVVNETTRDQDGKINGCASFSMIGKTEKEMKSIFLTSSLSMQKVERYETCRSHQIKELIEKGIEIEEVDTSELPFKFWHDYAVSTVFWCDQKLPERYISSFWNGKPIREKGFYAGDCPESGEKGGYIEGSIDLQKNKIIRFFDKYNMMSKNQGIYIITNKR